MTKSLIEHKELIQNYCMKQDDLMNQ